MVRRPGSAGRTPAEATRRSSSHTSTRIVSPGSVPSENRAIPTESGSPESAREGSSKRATPALRTGPPLLSMRTPKGDRPLLSSASTGSSSLRSDSNVTSLAPASAARARAGASLEADTTGSNVSRELKATICGVSPNTRTWAPASASSPARSNATVQLAPSSDAPAGHAGGCVQQDPATLGRTATRATGQPRIPEQEKHERQNHCADRAEEPPAGDREFPASVDPCCESPCTGHQNSKGQPRKGHRAPASGALPSLRTFTASRTSQGRGSRSRRSRPGTALCLPHLPLLCWHRVARRQFDGERIRGGSANAHLIVEVGTGSQARHPHVPNDVTLVDPATDPRSQ